MYRIIEEIRTMFKEVEISYYLENGENYIIECKKEEKKVSIILRKRKVYTKRVLEKVRKKIVNAILDKYYDVRLEI